MRCLIGTVAKQLRPMHLSQVFPTRTSVASAQFIQHASRGLTSRKNGVASAQATPYTPCESGPCSTCVCGQARKDAAQVRGQHICTLPPLQTNIPQATCIPRTPLNQIASHARQPSCPQCGIARLPNAVSKVNLPTLTAFPNAACPTPESQQAASPAKYANTFSPHKHGSAFTTHVML